MDSSLLISEDLLVERLKTRIEDQHGHRWYYLLGTNKLHRSDGPAFYHANGGVAYWRYGLIHNESGPALVDVQNRRLLWYIDDVLVKEEKFELDLVLE